MALINNPWVGYLERSYQQIKASLVNRLSVVAPEITDHSESNILIVIISMFSGVAEMLGYYIDNMAREAFIGTARRFVSMVKLVKLLDYRIRAMFPASVDITFTFLDGPGGNPVNLTSDGFIPKGISIETESGIVFTSTEDVVVPAGVSSIQVPFSQYVPVNANLGNTTGAANQSLVIGSNYVHDSADITINSEVWTRVNTLGYSGPTDKVFIVEIDTDGLAKVVFGDNTNGAIPTAGFAVMIDYKSSQGILGNVDPDTITEVGDLTGVTYPGALAVEFTNPLSAAGGTNYEDVEAIRRRAPLSIRTLDRAVTKQDYADVAVLAPGVGRAAVDFECGKAFDIYIIPEGGGLAQVALLNSTQAFVDERKMITTFPTIKSAGESILEIVMEVMGGFRVDASVLESEVEAALLSYGSFQNQDINKAIRASDIIALIDNLDKVDWLRLDSYKVKPYAMPQGHTTQLDWSREVFGSSRTEWRLEFDGSIFRIYKNTAYLGTVSIGSSYTDPGNEITLTINPGTYTAGEKWEFVTYPIDEDIELDDFTIPKTELAYLTLTVGSQNSI